MKVVFKLTPAQLIAAKKNVHYMTAADDEERAPEELWCGNLLGWMGHSFGFNPNQKLVLEGNLVIYEGERHPLAQDGGLTALYAIVAGGTVPEFPWQSNKYHLRKEWYEGRTKALKELQVISYETTDRSLHWWETKADWAERASLEEIRRELKKLAGLSRQKWDTPEWVTVAVKRLGADLLEIEVGTPAYRRIAAEGRLGDWRLVSSLEKLGYF